MATRQGDEPMADKWLVLVGDTETGHWSVVCQSSGREPVAHFLEENKTDPSPTIVLFTGDFLQ